jgi:hypothetical protein
MGEWRKLHSEELHNLYSSSSQGERWSRHVARMGEERKLNKVLVGKPKGNRPLGRRRHRWKDGIRMDLWEICWGGGVNWIRLPQDRDWWEAVVSVVMNLWVFAPRS